MTFRDRSNYHANYSDTDEESSDSDSLSDTSEDLYDGSFWPDTMHAAQRGDQSCTMQSLAAAQRGFLGRSRGPAELQDNYARRQQMLDSFFDTFLFRGPLFDFGIWDFPHASGGGGGGNQRYDSAAYAFAPRSAFDGVDMTRRRCDKRVPFPIQQYHTQQETRWVIPHEIG